MQPPPLDPVPYVYINKTILFLFIYIYWHVHSVYWQLLCCGRKNRLFCWCHTSSITLSATLIVGRVVREERLQCPPHITGSSQASFQTCLPILSFSCHRCSDRYFIIIYLVVSPCRLLVYRYRYYYTTLVLPIYAGLRGEDYIGLGIRVLHDHARNYYYLLFVYFGNIIVIQLNW